MTPGSSDAIDHLDTLECRLEGNCIGGERKLVHIAHGHQIRKRLRPIKGRILIVEF